MGTSVTVIRASEGEKLDSSTRDLFESFLGKHNVQTKLNPDQELESLTVPTKKLRGTIAEGDSSFRRALRGLPLELQDIVSKRRNVEIGTVMSSPVYVQEAKASGAIVRTEPSAGSLANSIDAFRDKLEDWGQVKIPAAILLLLAGGTLYGAWRLARVAEETFTEQARLLSEAAESEAGLERAVRARSGLSVPQVAEDPQEEVAPETQPDNESAHSSSAPPRSPGED